MVGAHRVRESPTQNPLISVLWSPDLVDFFRVDGWWSQAKELDAAFGRKKYSLILMMVWSLRILGPSNGRVWTCIAGVWVLKIATFEGSGFLGIYVFCFLFGENLECKKIWLHEKSKTRVPLWHQMWLRGADWSKKDGPNSPTSQVGCPDYLNFKVLHDVRMLIGLSKKSRFGCSNSVWKKKQN